VGALLAFVLAVGNIEGWFVLWESLGKPPEKAVKIIAITHGLWVETAAGHVYSHEGNPGCGDKCWVVSSYPESDPLPYFPLTACGEGPALARAIDMKAICSPWGPGHCLSVYAIRDDGKVFVWEHCVGEGNTIELLYSPFLGALIGFLAAVIIVLSKTGGRPTRHAACYFTMIMEGERVEAAKMSPSSGWLGLSVVRLGTDDPSAPSAGQALLAAACSAKRSRRTVTPG